MIITFVRHATAEDRETAPVDFNRILVEKGKKQVRRIQNFCKSNKLKPTILFSSPYPRAMETAMGLAELNTTEPYRPPQSASWLRLDSDPKAAVAHIKQLATNTEEIWLVGHEPHLSAVITLLLCTQIECTVSQSCFMPIVQVKKASMTRIDYQPEMHTAQLQWMVPCALMPQATSHKPQATSHKPQATSHKPQATSHGNTDIKGKHPTVCNLHSF